jgi:hypothetical protein
MRCAEIWRKLKLASGHSASRLKGQAGPSAENAQSSWCSRICIRCRSPCTALYWLHSWLRKTGTAKRDRIPLPDDVVRDLKAKVRRVGIEICQPKYLEKGISCLVCLTEFQRVGEAGSRLFVNDSKSAAVPICSLRLGHLAIIVMAGGEVTAPDDQVFHHESWIRCIW